MYSCNIQISFQCPDMPSEALLHDVESTELAIEDGVSGLLMELFGGTIIVNDVTVKFSLLQEERDE
jgi:hypothetical protein